MTFPARELLRHLLQVVAFCALVAVLTTAIWPNNTYWQQLGKSLSIGLITWAVIDFGRLWVKPEHCHPEKDGQHGWPKGWRGALLAALGISVGYLLGDPLGNALFGYSHALNAAETRRDTQIGLAVTLVAGIACTAYFYLRGQANALQAAKTLAERDATEARLRLLQSQLEPHMLFNTLANLRALIGIDPAAAQQMLDQLNDYLRATLEASRATQHPLAAEFDRLHDYLGLMAVRMGPRLKVDLQLPPELRDVPVPPLLLQPLVENAIQHGLEPRVEGGRVQVTAAREGDRLMLQVTDDGQGFSAGTLPRRAGSFGLDQVFDRVASAYGGRGEVELQSHPGQGTTVRVRLPLG
jgi:signal transduction histidine kinase